MLIWNVLFYQPPLPIPKNTTMLTLVLCLLSPSYMYCVSSTACLPKLSSLHFALYLSIHLVLRILNLLPLVCLSSVLSLYLCLVVKWWLTRGMQPRIWPTNTHTHLCTLKYTHILISLEYSVQATCCTYCTHKDAVEGQGYARRVRHSHTYSQRSVSQVKSDKQSVESHGWSRDIEWNRQRTHMQGLFWHLAMINSFHMCFLVVFSSPSNSIFPLAPSE